MESLNDKEDGYSGVAPVWEKYKSQFIATDAVSPDNKQNTYSFDVVYLWVIFSFVEFNFYYVWFDVFLHISQ